MNKGYHYSELSRPHIISLIGLSFAFEILTSQGTLLLTCCYVIELWHNSSIDKCDEIFNLLKLINYNEKQTGKNISCYSKFNIVQYFNRNNY